MLALKKSRPPRKPRLAALWLLGLLGSSLLVGCDLRLRQPVVEEIRERGSLVVLTRNAPTTYFENRDQQKAGFEHDLVVAFARHLGVTHHFKILNNSSEIFESLRRGEGDLAAAGLIRTAERELEFRFGPDYQEVDQQVVCRRGGRRPTDILRLAQVSLAVEAGGEHETRLQELKDLVPDLTWQSIPELSTEHILEKVWKKEVDCTIADSHVVAINRRYYPELVVKFPISATQPQAWVLPKRAMLLQREVINWFHNMEESGQLATLYDRYFGHVEPNHNEYDYVEHRSFYSRVNERLPEFKELFQEAADRYLIPWQLLAALAYQESHWDPSATSHTGVRGIMMLTRSTARWMGVKNRLDPQESILGGAWYLANLRRRLPEEIQEPDRTWIALASYNVGLGHIRDARELSRELGKNPNLWRDLRTVLPLLSRKKYYKQLKSGYARGSEPIFFVRHIRRYMDILEQMEKSAENPTASRKSS
ncbi:MAG: membrane-bound lytic murein transglycosylase MltF [Magnetococcales bacterium]|nr:membrane-bound lytic murein transglycosylase MltF [Magnetococcales bacterium]